MKHTYLKLLLLALSSTVLVSAQVIDSVEDGWCEDDDPYATCTDLLTVSYGSALDSTYSFDGSSYVDTWCVGLSTGASGSANYFINGVRVNSIPRWGWGTIDDPVNTGSTVTIQNTGGTTSLCRFSLWVNKSCDEVYPSQLPTPYSVGCEPEEHSLSISEGFSDLYTIDGNDVEVSCISSASQHTYLKCQAPTYDDLLDCYFDSRDDEDGGDNYRLYDFCVNNINSGENTEFGCDVNTQHSLQLFEPSATNPYLREMFDGFPTANFTVTAFTGCGVGTFDDTTVDTYELTSFDSKNTVCTTSTGYDVTGYVNGWYPHLGISGLVNFSLVYGSNVCSGGFVCSSTDIVSDDYDVDGLACYFDGGSCYDGIMNQDETSVDYGGVCGSCTNTSRRDDSYFVVAYATYPSGYFGVSNPFDPVLNCGDAEDASAGLLSFVVVVGGFIGLIVILLLLVSIIGLFIFAFRTATLFTKKDNLNKKEDIK